MGQTLTNGIFLPNEGERNCYTGLEGNWRAIDGYIGNYNVHVADVVIHVSQEDRNKWDAVTGKADSSALTAHTGDTTIHVTAADKTKWDAVTGKADDSSVVHKSGAETIAGQKTFSDNTFFTANVYHKYTSYESGNIPANNLVSNVYLADKNNVYVGCLRNVIYTSGRTSTEIRAKNTFKNGVLDPTGEDITSNLNVEVQPDGTKTISWDGFIRNNVVPYTTGNNFLGTSANKWKALNGINPGALGMPNLNERVDISGYITNLNGAYNSYLPSIDGWIAIQSNDATFIRISDTGSGGTGNTTTSPTAGILTCMMPVRANRQCNVYIVCSTLVSAYFIPCQGNT